MMWRGFNLPTGAVGFDHPCLSHLWFCEQQYTGDFLRRPEFETQYAAGSAQDIHCVVPIGLARCQSSNQVVIPSSVQSGVADFSHAAAHLVFMQNHSAVVGNMGDLGNDASLQVDSCPLNRHVQ